MSEAVYGSLQKPHESQLLANSVNCADSWSTARGGKHVRILRSNHNRSADPVGYGAGLVSAPGQNAGWVGIILATAITVLLGALMLLIG